MSGHPLALPALADFERSQLEDYPQALQVHFTPLVHNTASWVQDLSNNLRDLAMWTEPDDEKIRGLWDEVLMTISSFLHRWIDKLRPIFGSVARRFTEQISYPDDDMFEREEPGPPVRFEDGLLRMLDRESAHLRRQVKWAKDKVKYIRREQQHKFMPNGVSRRPVSEIVMQAIMLAHRKLLMISKWRLSLLSARSPSDPEVFIK